MKNKPNTATPLEKLFVFIVGSFLAVVFIIVYTWAILLAWNCAVVPLCHAPRIGFWQVFAIMFLLGAVRRMVFVSPKKD